jgi:hypothetical protein
MPDNHARHHPDFMSQVTMIHQIKIFCAVTCLLLVVLLMNLYNMCIFFKDYTDLYNHPLTDTSDAPTSEIQKIHTATVGIRWPNKNPDGEASSTILFILSLMEKLYANLKQDRQRDRHTHSLQIGFPRNSTTTKAVIFIIGSFFLSWIIFIMPQ